jgi:hypothetical protein
MLDEQSGKAYSLVVVEDEASGARVREALAQRPAERRVRGDPDQVQFLTAIRVLKPTAVNATKASTASSSSTFVQQTEPSVPQSPSMPAAHRSRRASASSAPRQR